MIQFIYYIDAKQINSLHLLMFILAERQCTK